MAQSNQLRQWANPTGARESGAVAMLLTRTARTHSQIERDIAEFRAQFPTEPRPFTPLPMISWQMLERQLIALRGPNKTPADVRHTLRLLFERSAVKPVELTLADILTTAWIVMDETQAEIEPENEPGEAPMP